MPSTCPTRTAARSAVGTSTPDEQTTPLRSHQAAQRTVRAPSSPMLRRACDERWTFAPDFQRHARCSLPFFGRAASAIPTAANRVPQPDNSRSENGAIAFQNQANRDLGSRNTKWRQSSDLRKRLKPAISRTSRHAATQPPEMGSWPIASVASMGQVQQAAKRGGVPPVQNIEPLDWASRTCAETRVSARKSPIRKQVYDEPNVALGTMQAHSPRAAMCWIQRPHGSHESSARTAHVDDSRRLGTSIADPIDQTSSARRVLGCTVGNDVPQILILGANNLQFHAAIG